MLEQVNQIVKGHANELLNREKDLYNYRKPICNSCKLRTHRFILGINTEICNDKMWLNPTTDELSLTPKNGFKNGCSCRIEAATRTKDKKCPLGKW